MSKKEAKNTQKKETNEKKGDDSSTIIEPKLIGCVNIYLLFDLYPVILLESQSNCILNTSRKRLQDMNAE